MKTRALATVILGLIVVFLGGCASQQYAGHKYVVRGQIVDVVDGVVYFCVGKEEGAAVGQEYEVYNFVKTGTPKSGPLFTKVAAGTIQLTEINDEHLAKGKVLSGKVETNYTVELKK